MLRFEQRNRDSEKLKCSGNSYHKKLKTENHELKKNNSYILQQLKKPNLRIGI